MTALMTALEELEELLFGDPLCEVEHEDILEDSLIWGQPCAIVATAVVGPACDMTTPTLVCRPLAEILGEDDTICLTCGHRCFEVHSI